MVGAGRGRSDAVTFDNKLLGLSFIVRGAYQVLELTLRTNRRSSRDQAAGRLPRRCVDFNFMHLFFSFSL